MVLQPGCHMCVHANGTANFAYVSCPCRRDVWHGGDMAGAGRLRAQWNEALLQLVVAPAYLDLLSAAAETLGPGPAYNRQGGSLLCRTLPAEADCQMQHEGALRHSRLCNACPMLWQQQAQKGIVVVL